jgi:hypothetical protein
MGLSLKLGVVLIVQTKTEGGAWEWVETEPYSDERVIELRDEGAHALALRIGSRRGPIADFEISELLDSQTEVRIF